MSLAITSNHPLGWTIVLDVLGWTYFLSWSASFWPQAILNYRRKSATGLSQDFSILNPIGFLCYSIYNLLFKFDPLIRSQYAARHAGKYPQVSYADIGFSVHAFVLSAVCLFQTYWYARKSAPTITNTDERTSLLRAGEHVNDVGRDLKSPRKESITLWTKASIPAVLIGLAYGGIRLKQGKWQEIDLVYYISYVKLYISIAKWIPQLILNHVHRSTIGFSTSVVLLDMLGSVTSFLELVISSLLDNDPGAIVGNPAKLFLSALTFTFDLVFVGQRWVFYRPSTREAGHSGVDRHVQV